MNNLRKQCWIFTLNNYTYDEEKNIRDLYELYHQVSYIVYGREVGTHNTPHLQGYLRWNNARTRSATKKLLGNRVHLEIRRGTFLEASNYCKKDGDYYENGELPLSSKEKGEKSKEKWKQIIKFAKTNNFEAIEEEYPQIFVSHYRTLRYISKDYMTKPNDLKEMDNHWLWGPPGTGKSYTARNKWGNDYYLKNSNKWWDGYMNEETIIIEEIEKDCGKFMGHFLKIWCDIYSFIGETKGGAIRIRPKRIIVTTNYPINDIFDFDIELNNAIHRRFKETVFLITYNN